GRDLPRHRSPPVVPDQVHGTETGDLDELDDVPGQLRVAIRMSRAGPGARRVPALVGCDGAVSTRVQERGYGVPGARVLRETMQEKYRRTLERPGVTHVEDEPVPREAGDALGAHRTPTSCWQ